ncbi:hypothetical protein LPJ66_008838 [Kickxella alabastrina]|uniref:Uncharacterized protein n=1 Tax=Kickxella alabastrina TaxID=61397 RepID=A0ACC1I8S6_9FUNG|nr:hypothetical protein LPJ66_008838 [Kickxella alabastrina]
MHHAQPPGLGGILIWAQPSQWLPMDLRAQAWESARQCNVAEHKQADHKQADHRVVGSSLGECPGEFIDFITQNIMVDPVVLPGGARCDRSTIRRHLGTVQTDPFTGLPMEYGQAKPDLALQQRIQRWGEKQAK